MHSKHTLIRSAGTAAVALLVVAGAAFAANTLTAPGHRNLDTVSTSTGQPSDATPAQLATETPEPTETPEATETAEPAGTPEATETPEATDTPEPSETPEATDTPEPSETPDAGDEDAQGQDVDAQGEDQAGDQGSGAESHTQATPEPVPAGHESSSGSDSGHEGGGGD